MTENANRTESALSLSDVVAAAAHDLTTPLSTILGLTQLLLDDKPPDEATRREFLLLIHAQAAQLERIVQNLKEFSLVEAGGPVTPHWEHLTCDELLAGAVARATPAAVQKGITLTAVCAENLRCIQTDRGMAGRVLDNLLGNAIKYTAEGGRIEVNAGQGATPKFVRITVRDTGSGISPNDLPHVFERGYRGQTADIEGRGLGLYIASKLTALLGGTIGVESEEGKGSRFFVELPAGADDLPD